MARTLLALGLLAAGVHGDDVATAGLAHSVTGRLTFPNNLAVPTTALSLNGGEFAAMTGVDGTFAFHDVPPGIHLLDVLSPLAMFPQVKLNVPSEPDGKVKALEYKYPGAPKQPAAYPLELAALAKMQYFEARPQVSIMRMIMGNPMMLMMGVMVLLMTVAPKMLGTCFYVLNLPCTSVPPRREPLLTTPTVGSHLFLRRQVGM